MSEERDIAKKAEKERYVSQHVSPANDLYLYDLGRTSGGNKGADLPSRQMKGAQGRVTLCGASAQHTP